MVTLISKQRGRLRGRGAGGGRAPRADAETFARYALLGIYVGFIPVGLGLLWYPFLRRLGPRGLRFILALTVGLLLFLLFDTVAEALELIATTPGVFGGAPLVFLVALLAFGLLVAVAQGPQGAASAGACRWPTGSRWASGCTTWARGWRSARPSRWARRRWARSW